MQLHTSPSLNRHVEFLLIITVDIVEVTVEVIVYRAAVYYYYHDYYEL